jgi:hypothetical protein
MGKCAECIHYPWDVSIDPDQLLVFKKCHKDSGPRRWTQASRDAENTCALFESGKESKTEKAPKAPKEPGKKGGKGKKTDTQDNPPDDGSTTEAPEGVNEENIDAGDE